MLTHRISLPDGTIIEFFTNADEIEGGEDIDMEQLWNKAGRMVKRTRQQRRKQDRKIRQQSRKRNRGR